MTKDTSVAADVLRRAATFEMAEEGTMLDQARKQRELRLARKLKNEVNEDRNLLMCFCCCSMCGVVESIYTVYLMFQYFQLKAAWEDAFAPLVHKAEDGAADGGDKLVMPAQFFLFGQTKAFMDGLPGMLTGGLLRSMAEEARDNEEG